MTSHRTHREHELQRIRLALARRGWTLLHLPLAGDSPESFRLRTTGIRPTVIFAGSIHALRREVDRITNPRRP